MKKLSRRTCITTIPEFTLCLFKVRIYFDHTIEHFANIYDYSLKHLRCIKTSTGNVESNVKSRQLIDPRVISFGLGHRAFPAAIYLVDISTHAYLATCSRHLRQRKQSIILSRQVATVLIFPLSLSIVSRFDDNRSRFIWVDNSENKMSVQILYLLKRIKLYD